MILPSRGEIADPNATVAPAAQLSTTDSIPGYRILRSHGIVFAQAPNRYQGFGTSGMDNKQARKTTILLLENLLPIELARSGGNAVIGLKFDVHDTFTIVYGTAVTVDVAE